MKKLSVAGMIGLALMLSIPGSASAHGAAHIDTASAATVSEQVLGVFSMSEAERESQIAAIMTQLTTLLTQLIEKVREQRAAGL
jgi:TolA-binding protein